IAEHVLGKSLPFSMEAERAVLGSLLLHDGQSDTVTDILSPEDFYNASHKTIFKAIVRIFERKQKLDVVVLQDELVKTEMLSTVGGVGYLVSLQEDIPSLGLLEQHSRI